MDLEVSRRDHALNRGAERLLYKNQAQSVEDGDRRSEIVLLGRIGSPRLLTDPATFVRTVADIKASVTGRDAGEPPVAASEDVDEDELEFSPEFEGTKSVAVSTLIEAKCHHGTVVRQLREALQEHRWTAGNDRARDLVARSLGGDCEITFEIKTDPSAQSIYTGVGRLVMRARPASAGATAVLVVPGEVEFTANFSIRCGRDLRAESSRR